MTTEFRILVVDDEPANVRLLERMLAEAGYRQVKTTKDPREVLALYGEFQPDLICRIVRRMLVDPGAGPRAEGAPGLR